MRRRFFVECFNGGSAVLRGEAAHHLGRVLRAEPGQLYELSDGESAWLARAECVRRDAVEFTLVERLAVTPARLCVTLMIAVVKFERFEWAIEKATELGVDEIVPLAAERSEKGLIAASVKRAERWEKILTESAQQSRRLKVPILRDTAEPKAAFRSTQAQIRVLLSERSGATPMREVLETADMTFRDSEKLSVAMAIGPEGGWTAPEFSAALDSGFAEAALGNNILRTETAVCAGLAAIQYAFGTGRHEHFGKSAEIKGENA